MEPYEGREDQNPEVRWNNSRLIPMYLKDGVFTRKLIRHVHEKQMHHGTANTMAAIRKQWWIPQLRSLHGQETDTQLQCLQGIRGEASERHSNFPIAEVSYGSEQTVSMHWRRLRRGPLIYKDTKQHEGKAYIQVIIFTCAVAQVNMIIIIFTCAVVHLEVTKSQSTDRRISEEVKRVYCQENQTTINRLRQRNGVQNNSKFDSKNPEERTVAELSSHAGNSLAV